ncbi:MAG: acetyltransferase [Leptolyngbya sp. SIO4C5]|nr:acetyltransferase [Leptolyngbya sp. SIO4C5]
MFLKHSHTGNLVEVLTLPDLWDPCRTQVTGRFHAGEELQEPESFAKADLQFPSEEALPRCWTDPDYREHLPAQTGKTAIAAN